jgi:hypothetical protein
MSRDRGDDPHVGNLAMSKAVPPLVRAMKTLVS